MARVIRLPSGDVFKAKPKLRKLGMGNKGAFSIVELGKAVDMIDKVATSKGIGSAASAIERGLEPDMAKSPGEKAPLQATAPHEIDPETHQPRGSKEDLMMKQAAAARIQTRRAPARAPVQAPVRREAPPVQAEAKTGIDFSGIQAPLPNTQGGVPIPRPIDRERTPSTELPVQEIRAGMPGTTVPGRPDLVPMSQKKEQMLRRSTREEVEAGQAPVQAPGPAQAKTPQSASPLAARQVQTPQQLPRGPADSQPVPVSGETPPLSAKGTSIKGTPVKQIQTTANQVVANIYKEAQRNEPAAAAIIDSAAYKINNTEPRTAASFISAMIDGLRDKGLVSQAAPEQKVEIPEVVSIEHLLGLARAAKTRGNQQAILNAFAQNTVTGMGYSTLAERMSGNYRKPYLSAIMSSFPKPEKAMDPIDALYKSALAYSNVGLGRLRSRQEGAGKAEADVGLVRARTAATGAGAQVKAEKAVTERELREAKRQDLITKATSRMFKDALAKSKQARRGRGGKKTKPGKVNLNILSKEFTGRFDDEQKRLRTSIDTLDKELANASGLAGMKEEIVSNREIALNPAGAAKKEARNAKIREAQGKLRTLKAQRAGRVKLWNALRKNREKASVFVASIAAGNPITEEQMKAYGLTNADVLAIREGTADSKIPRSRRQGSPERESTKTQPVKDKELTEKDFE